MVGGSVQNPFHRCTITSSFSDDQDVPSAQLLDFRMTAPDDNQLASLSWKTSTKAVESASMNDWSQHDLSTIVTQSFISLRHSNDVSLASLQLRQLLNQTSTNLTCRRRMSPAASLVRLYLHLTCTQASIRIMNRRCTVSHTLAVFGYVELMLYTPDIDNYAY